MSVMKLLADESVDLPIIVRLRADDHEGASIAEESPGIMDDEVLNRAYGERVLLLTGDKDFGELVYRHQFPHAGILLIRLAGQSESEKCDLVSIAVQNHGPKLPEAFSVLTADALRIRNSPAH